MLTEFDSFEHQDLADLAYGQQLEGCQKQAEVDTDFEDHSIGGDWTPDED